MFVLIITKKVLYLWYKMILENKYNDFSLIMKETRKIIRVPLGAVEKLMEVTNASMSSVYNALAYRNNSDSAKRIRARALAEFGGKKINKEIEL